MESGHFVKNQTKDQIETDPKPRKKKLFTP